MSTADWIIYPGNEEPTELGRCQTLDEAILLARSMVDEGLADHVDVRSAKAKAPNQKRTEQIRRWLRGEFEDMKDFNAYKYLLSGVGISRSKAIRRDRAWVYVKSKRGIGL
ncbi:MAG: hypothetical protein PVJ86_02680 [Phycisphaerales bacterium]